MDLWTASQRTLSYVEFLRGLRAFLRRPMTLEDAKRTIAWRLRNRHRNFLSAVKRCIYGNPWSPYLPLLSEAGCRYGDLEREVRRLGVEGALEGLRRGGVWLTLEQFKGRQPIGRHPDSRTFPADAFLNPRTEAGLVTRTGGSSGKSSTGYLTFANILLRARYDRLYHSMLELDGLLKALWLPGLPASVGIANCLRHTKLGKAPERWFDMFVGGADAATAQARLATAAVIWAAGLTARRLPLPEATPLDRADAVVDWIISARRRGGGRCVLQTYVSQAVRVSQAASARGLDLNGVVFIVGSEPLTEAKQQAVVKTGAQVYSRYATTEIGMLGIGCGRPMEAGDLHLVSDSIACIHGTEDAGTAAPYHFTTLLPQSPVVMLNVQMGDAGFLERQRCGCLLDDLGLGMHLRQVRSFSRATGEGVAWFRPELQRIVEELLPARYGGSPLDYQWVEAEDERALTRLLLRVHPRLGPLDADTIAEDVLAELSRGHAARRIPVERWRQAGTIRVVRQPPQATSRGKMLPILQERPASGVRGKQ